MAVKHTINGIEFNDIKTSNKSFIPIVNSFIYNNNTDELNSDYGTNGALPTIINGVEIDWNSADLSDVLGEEFASITTTGQLFAAIKKIAQMANKETTVSNDEMEIEVIS